MGMFDKMKKQMQDMQKKMGNMNMGNMGNMNMGGGATQDTPPYDANDPKMEPIEGITLEKFAEVSGKLSKNSPMDLDKVTPFVEGLGIKPGTWTTVQSGWMLRVQEDQKLQMYYNGLFTKHMQG